MKQWMQKLIGQFDLDWQSKTENGETLHINEEKATLLYIIDTYNKNLVDFESHPVRKTREVLDEYAKELVKAEGAQLERVLFRFRQYFSSYRIDEYTYMQKTFDDFRNIIWDFVDQLSEDLNYEKSVDEDVKSSLEQLKEAVEANSIDVLKTQSRQFIDSYVEHQTRKDKRRTDRLRNIKKNLDTMKKQLVEANTNMRMDHLTNAYNRKSFDEQVKHLKNLFTLSQQPSVLIMLDIDHFKRVNDTFGHANGDFVLVECVRILKEVFSRETDFVARVGGEEFAILIPDCHYDLALKKAEQAMQRIRAEAYVKDDMKITFTVSMGIAELVAGEDTDTWIKRADKALYHSKTTGRNKYTLAEPTLTKSDAA